MQLSKHSFAITGLGATPPWVVNAGFIVGDEQTLIIDTGANWLAAQTIHGYATAVRPHNELLVFNTEPHFDHIGGNSYFHERGIAIYGHPEIQRTKAQFEAEKVEFNQSITNPVRAEAQEAEAAFVHTALVNPNRQAIAGHLFDLGGVEAEILATPGHTVINQSVYNRTEGILFCADCIVTGYIPNMEAGRRQEWHKWLDSLALIESLAPTAIVPGHGVVIHGDEISVQIERTRGYIEHAIKEGKAPTV